MRRIVAPQRAMLPLSLGLPAACSGSMWAVYSLGKAVSQSRADAASSWSSAWESVGDYLLSVGVAVSQWGPLLDFWDSLRMKGKVLFADIYQNYLIIGKQKNWIGSGLSRMVLLWWMCVCEGTQWQAFLKFAYGVCIYHSQNFSQGSDVN